MELNSTESILIQALGEKQDKVMTEANRALADIRKAFDALLDDCIKKYMLDPKKKWKFVGNDAGISIVEDIAPDQLKEAIDAEKEQLKSNL